MKSIREFIEKKKSEAKFKRAGRGHTLASSSPPPGSSTSGTASASGSGSTSGGGVGVGGGGGGVSHGARMAGAAALARHDQSHKKYSQSSRQLALLRAQARAELEQERAALSSSVASDVASASVSPDHTATCSHDNIAANLAAAGVFYKCTIIGPDVLPRREIDAKLRQFLYEQLDEDAGFASCLIIHSCNKDRQQVEACVSVLCQYLDNIIAQPDVAKFRRIRCANRVFAQRVAPLDGVDQFLTSVGFRRADVPCDTDTAAPETVWLMDQPEDLARIESLRDALVSAEPIVPELDRNVRVLMPAQAAVQIQLPPDFFAISVDEIKREAQLKSELVDQLTTLQTREMRQRCSVSRDLRHYRYCIVRVRMPDALILQGTFRCLERVSAVMQFVRESLTESLQQLPFILIAPGGQRFNDPSDSCTLLEARLVPSTLLIWQSDTSSDSDTQDSVYLLSELMALVSEI